MQENISLRQFSMLFLSVYVRLAAFVETVCNISKDMQTIMQVVDTGICLIFLSDFFLGLYQAPNKTQYLKWGWINFVSSIPMLDIFRWGRIIQVIRILRILRSVRSMKVLMSFLLQNRAKAAFTSVALSSVIFVLFSSIAILNLENHPDCNIKNAEDALWWACSTITTVGYGDKFPITTGGRILGAFLMIIGVTLFGIFTACITSWFLQVPKAQKYIEKKEQFDEILVESEA